MLVPPYLQPGDTVLMCATARTLSHAEAHACIEACRGYGLRVEVLPNTHLAHHQFAGTDAERLAALNHALRHPEAKAIIFARGGYGTTRILDQADWPALRQHPKWLVGFSDLTAALAAAAGLGVASIHGPMAISYGMDVSPASLNGLLRLLTGQGFHQFEPPLVLPHPANRPGNGSGPLIGGNLSLLAHMVGTPHEFDYRGAILFIEDLDEYYYHIDRMLRQLRRAGRLAGLAGLVVGSFIKLRDNAIPFGQSLEEIVLDVVADYDFPVLFGFPTGHDRDNLPLVIGAQTQMDVQADTVRLRQQL